MLLSEAPLQIGLCIRMMLCSCACADCSVLSSPQPYQVKLILLSTPNCVYGQEANGTAVHSSRTSLLTSLVAAV